MKKYTTKSGVVQYKPSLKSIENSIEYDTSEGFCLACGHSVSGVEPDAHQARCECCGAKEVYGAEELLLMGLFH